MEARCTRLLAAAPERLFEALADPAQRARWWGRGDHAIAKSARPGRIVFDLRSPPPAQRVTVLLAPAGSGTRVTWIARTSGAPAIRANVEPFLLESIEQRLDRLEAYLERTSGTGR